jgi:predicted RND superfamily exporter protein
VVRKFSEFCIDNRKLVIGVVAAITLILGFFAVQVEIKTQFADLLPARHPYMNVHNVFKETYGGSNMVSLMLEVQEGDIFTPEVLGKVKTISRELQQVAGVNQFQIVSLATRKLKQVKVTAEGIESYPLMWPDVPKTPKEIAELREAVLNNALVFGSYVSRDLKATLITVDFYDQFADYITAFQQIREIVRRNEGKNLKIRVVGEPVLYGWVRHYLPETFHIFLLTIAGMIAFLFVVSRTYRGTILPLLAGFLSAVWALGFARLLGFNFDPLVIVVAFLITARSISHSTQLVTRFDDEWENGAANSQEAAKKAMVNLFKPGMLGVVADAGCIIVVILTPIPLLEKVAIIGTIWVSTIALSAVVLTPVLLSWVNKPTYAHGFSITNVLRKFLDLCVSIVTSRGRYAVLLGALVIFLISGIYAFNIKVGDANPGSPILWPDSNYNKDAAEVNAKFRGSDRMFVVAEGKEGDSMKDPDVLTYINKFQRHMEAQPEIGGTISIADILPSLKRTLREANPRYEEIGSGKYENAELMYLFVSGSDPGDAERFFDVNQYNTASVTLFFRDHQGETIRTAVQRVHEFQKKEPYDKAAIKLAGGFVGVIAAVNEVILSGQIESIALGLLVLVICCGVAYRSTSAGLFFMVPVILSNTITFSYMAFKKIGMNINTLPVAALGIGLGVDYAFYIVDGIKEELHESDDIVHAITRSLHSAGRGVLVTAGALIASVVLWWFSSLRFQAEMGIMMALWLCVSASCALFVMPSLVYVLRPKFIFEKEGVKFTGRGG